MKDRFKLFSMALCACAFAACNDMKELMDR